MGYYGGMGYGFYGGMGDGSYGGMGMYGSGSGYVSSTKPNSKSSITAISNTYSLLEHFHLPTESSTEEWVLIICPQRIMGPWMTFRMIMVMIVWLIATLITMGTDGATLSTITMLVIMTEETAAKTRA